MTTPPEYSQLSLFVCGTAFSVNEIALPTGWQLAEPFHPDDSGGLAYGVFRRIGTTEIALVYAGSNESLIADSRADNFRFGSPADGNDTITDFLVGVDKLVVASSSFGSLVLGALGATQYVAGTALTANQAFAQFLYSTTTGQLAFVADGTGATEAVNLATLMGLPALTAGDIWVGA